MSGVLYGLVMIAVYEQIGTRQAVQETALYTADLVTDLAAAGRMLHMVQGVFALGENILADGTAAGDV